MMKVDNDTKQFIKLRLENNVPEVENLSPIELREMRASMAEVPYEHQVQINNINEIKIKSENRKVKLRIYSNIDNDDQPLIIFFHGGGFVMGDLDSHDLLCRHLAKKSECKLIAIDYSLAPEYKFPCSLEDSINAVNYIFENNEQIKFDKKKVVVCGDSAGGNLALIVAILSKEKKLPKIIGQILFYPWIDFTMSRPSMSINLDGLIVKKSTLDYFADHYLNKNDKITNWKISPLLYSDFYGMPITYIYGAGLDPLVDEGYALMKRLKSFENEVYYKVYEGQMHAFVSNIVNLPTSIDCINEACKAIKKIIQIN
ncbi:alpha/beta hydrolase [Alphaproteobacteria bacterium]|nr:alpha/beta hydrolase [Alphaproteobacteria bacterium]